MRIDRIKYGMHEGFLLILASRLVSGQIKTYVLADAGSGSVIAYGPCPCAALELIGRDGRPSSFMEFVNRAVLAADSGYYLDAGIGVPMEEVGAAWRVPDEDKRFFSAETAALASAVAGWPEPITLFPLDERKDR